MMDNTAKIIDISPYIDSNAAEKRQQKKKAEAAKEAAKRHNQRLLICIGIPAMLICLGGLYASVILFMGIFPSLDRAGLYVVATVLTVLWLRWFISILSSAKEWIFAKRK